MKFIKWAIKDSYDIGKHGLSNDFLIEYPGTSLEISIIDLIKKHNIKINEPVVSVSRGYPNREWKSDSDIFCLFKEYIIDLLQKRKCFLLIDNSVEGHSDLVIPLIQSIYYNCDLYRIDPDLIFLIHGNLKADTFNSIYKHIFKIKKTINIITINGCEAQVIDTFNDDIRSNDIQYEKICCHVEPSDKLLLSLSRRTRDFRTLAQFLLSKSRCYDKFILSQDTVPQGFLENLKILDHDNNLDLSDFHQWCDTLPILADNTDFNHNYAGNLSRDLYRKTIYSLVLETNQIDDLATSLFYSEKSFKPIICYQPFLIFGQYGCNYGIKEFGYKTYENYFHLDEFDFENNPVTRLIKILQEIERVNTELISMTRTQQIDWRFQYMDLLEFNRNVFFQKKYFNNKITQLIKTMNSISKKENKIHWIKY